MSVQGVVVHARKYTFSSPLTLKRTAMDGSSTGLYPQPTSCDESAVPHLGHQGLADQLGVLPDEAVEVLDHGRR